MDKPEFERYDRLKDIAKQIQDGHEYDVKLEIETLCSKEILDIYFELIKLVNLQIERKDFLEFYVMNLFSILSEDPKKKYELEILIAQAEQYDYYEPVYKFCDNYLVRVQLPYDMSKDEFISYREERQSIITRGGQIMKYRKQCVEMIKQEMKKLV